MIRPPTLTLTLALTAALAPSFARAQSLAERVSDDPCDQARAFEVGDTGAAAQRAWRACRLARLEERLAAERRTQMAAQAQAQEARIRTWLAATQPIRVLRPFAIEGFAGSGLANYGLGLSWFVLRRLELGGRVGWREIGYGEFFSSSGSARYQSINMGVGARWLLSDKDFSPFVGAGLSMTGANIEVTTFNPMRSATPVLVGVARAHSASLSGGVQLAVRSLRVSLEYIFESIFYTGANLANVEQTPDDDVRVVWRDSLTKDRHGIRFGAGIAF